MQREELVAYCLGEPGTAYNGRYGWNTLRVGGAVPDDEVRDAVDASCADVVARLPRSKRPAAPS